MHEQYRGIIFDMDGVLIDSEPLYKTIENEMYQSLGIAPTPEMIKKSMGRGCENWWRDLKAWYDLAIDPVAQAETETAFYLTYLEDPVRRPALFPDVRHCFESLYKAGYRLTIASGSARKVVEKVVALLGVSNWIDGFLTSEDVVDGKPHPAIMLQSAQNMGVMPETCLVIDDATNGLQAARNAGMDCWLFTSAAEGMADASLANDVVESHREIMDRLLR
ncbi:HAD family phosphatase [Pseudoramibacter faecis]|uniref:HAD family hydrolase n=1 Tax=Pseudoramibacter faecis TaxID=3108534 RepID=UPI002E780E92|nr:HAD family phosphatase [Pseudoramibacter sp. HA2172]